MPPKSKSRTDQQNNPIGFQIVEKKLSKAQKLKKDLDNLIAKKQELEQSKEGLLNKMEQLEKTQVENQKIIIELQKTVQYLQDQCKSFEEKEIQTKLDLDEKNLCINNLREEQKTEKEEYERKENLLIIEVENLKSDNEKLKTDANDALLTLKSEHERDMDRLKKIHEDTLDRHQESMSKLKDKYNNKKSLVKDLSKQKDKTTADFEEEYDKAKSTIKMLESDVRRLECGNDYLKELKKKVEATNKTLLKDLNMANRKLAAMYQPPFYNNRYKRTTGPTSFGRFFRKPDRENHHDYSSPSEKRRRRDYD